MKNIFSNKIKNDSKGAISVIVALSVLAIILTIGLSASYVTSSELRISGNASKSVKAFYVAETGMERAMYERFKDEAEPLPLFRCAGTCNAGNAACCNEAWSPEGYCLIITESTACDYSTITAIKSIGEYDFVRRSVEISF